MKARRPKSSEPCFRPGALPLRHWIAAGLFGLAGTLQAGVWAHYSFDADYSDVSGSGNHGVLTDVGTPANSGITNTPGDWKFGGASMFFSRDRDVIAIPSRTFSTGIPYTIAFWAKKAPGDTGDPAMWDMVVGQRGNTKFFVALNDASGSGNRDGIRWRSNHAASGIREADWVAEDDTDWHHYAITADSSNHLRFYRDGSPVSALPNVQTGFILDTIGEAYDTSRDFDFHGHLDEMWIFDEPLDATQVGNLYARNTLDPEPDLSVTRVRVFLQGGQSNADGRASPNLLPTTPVNLQEAQADVDLYYRVEGGSGHLIRLQPGRSETAQFGPEVTLGRRLTDRFQQGSETRVALIKYANGATDLKNDWKAGGDATTAGDGPDYVVFQQTVVHGLAALAAAYPAASIAIEGMVWHQGESDIVGGTHADYQAGLTGFIADVRATFAPDLPFVTARLSIHQTALNAAGLAVVRTAQQAVADADPRVRWVDTDSMGMQTDQLHLDADGQQDLGIALAEAAAMLRWMVETFPPADIDAGLAEPGANLDGDPHTNEQEYIAGTDATSAASFLQLQLFFHPPDTLDIHYPGAENRLYVVEAFNKNLQDWEEKLADAPGNGGTTQRTLPIENSPMHLRVRASMP